MDKSSFYIGLDNIAADSFNSALVSAVQVVKSARAQYSWVGVYLANDQVLTLEENHYLGPKTLETHIPFSEGICGACATSRETIIVDDVRGDYRYIACSPAVLSEIVVPIMANDHLVGVLDLDSDELQAFDQADQQQLEGIARLLAKIWLKEQQSVKAGD
ncbi:GAF domain-containing protein [Candidatus Neomarinimicrobiota bacterium]